MKSWTYDRALYKLRHFMEIRVILEFTAVAGSGRPGMPRTFRSYLASWQIRAMAIWTKLL